MSIHLKKESLSAIEEAFESADHSWQTTFNFRQAVDRLTPLIEKLRTYNMSWEEIATKMEAAIGEDIEINPRTLQQYYQESKKQNKKQSKQKASKRQRLNVSKGEPTRDLESKTQRLGSENRTKDVGFDLRSHLDGIAEETSTELPLNPDLVSSDHEANLPSSRQKKRWEEPRFNRNRVRPQRHE